MKRLTPRYRRWLVARAYSVAQRRSRANSFRVADIAARQEDLIDLKRRLSALPQPQYSSGEWINPKGKKFERVSLLAPTELSISSNYSECMAFVEELRRTTFVDGRYSGPYARKKQARFIADLAPVEGMSLDGALIIAAEFDRIRRVRHFRPSMDDAKWQPAIRGALEALGFYNLIEVSSRTASPEDDEYDFGLSFVPLVSGHQVETAKAKQLLDALKGAAGDAPNYRPMYDGLIEAIGNVRAHAYPVKPRGGLFPHFPQWWAAGAFDPKQRRLHVSVYDQGFGIPRTIRDKTAYAPLFALFTGGGTDAERIAVALEYGKTSTGDAGRGNGLWRMAKLIDECPGSQVRIYSGRGMVSYLGPTNCDKSILPSEFCGTLVHWDLKLPEPDMEE